MKPPRLSGAKPARVLRWVLAGLALTSSLTPQTTLASGVVVNCTDADLRATLAGGGTVLPAMAPLY